MVNTITIILAAVAVTLGSVSNASAMHGGGGHGGFGGGGHGGFGVGHAAFAPAGGLGHVSAAHSFAGGGSRFAFRDRFRFGHRFARDRFFFAGAPFDYWYGYGYDDCYVRTWTPYGWRWRFVCY